MIDYKAKTKEELMSMVAENRSKLQGFRFAMTGGKIKNVKEGRSLRREVARILTESSRRTRDGQ